MGGWKDMDTMRKAGINIKDVTAYLDDMEVHGVRTAQILNLKF